jgi:hypothetical protein
MTQMPRVKYRKLITVLILFGNNISHSRPHATSADVQRVAFAGLNKDAKARPRELNSGDIICTINT